MDFFKEFLFGIVGSSIIFWVCVVALWHTYMFPRLFSEDYSSNISSPSANSSTNSSPSLIDRGKYSRQFFVIADFNNSNDMAINNRLYIYLLFSLVFMSFLLLVYGLHSGFLLYDIK